MAQNRGKQFEAIIREAFSSIPDVSIDRLLDPMAGYAGVRNICDFIVYREPYEYYLECKSVHGGTFPLNNLTTNQYEGLLEKSKIKGVFAGVIVWWIDRNVTKYVPIQVIERMKRDGYKSIGYNAGVPYGCEYIMIPIEGRKKRVFFEYDIEQFLNTMERSKL